MIRLSVFFMFTIVSVAPPVLAGNVIESYLEGLAEGFGKRHGEQLGNPSPVPEPTPEQARSAHDEAPPDVRVLPFDGSAVPAEIFDGDRKYAFNGCQRVAVPTGELTRLDSEYAERENLKMLEGVVYLSPAIGMQYFFSAKKECSKGRYITYQVRMSQSGWRRSSCLFR